MNFAVKNCLLPRQHQKTAEHSRIKKLFVQFLALKPFRDLLRETIVRKLKCSILSRYVAAIYLLDNSYNKVPIMLYKKSILDVFDVISVSFSVNSRFQIIIASKHFEVAQEIDPLFLTRELGSTLPERSKILTCAIKF